MIFTFKKAIFTFTEAEPGEFCLENKLIHRSGRATIGGILTISILLAVNIVNREINIYALDKELSIRQNTLQ